MEMVKEHYGLRLNVKHSDDSGIEFHFADRDTMTKQNEPDPDAKAMRVLSSKKANMVIIFLSLLICIYIHSSMNVV